MLSLTAAHLDLDLAKNRVDLHRWRQRTALLKVRLSSAHEDVERYRANAARLRRQAELEAATGRAAGTAAAVLLQRATELEARMAEQGAVLAAVQADLLHAQEAVADRDRQLAEEQAAAVSSGDQAQATLAEARAKCARLQEQLAAAQERAALADQTAVAAQVGKAELLNVACNCSWGWDCYERAEHFAGAVPAMCLRHQPPLHAAQERAKLAEQTLRQKEELLAEKERLQSDMQHISQVSFTALTCR